MELIIKTLLICAAICFVATRFKINIGINVIREGEEKVDTKEVIVDMYDDKGDPKEVEEPNNQLVEVMEYVNKLFLEDTEDKV